MYVCKLPYIIYRSYPNFGYLTDNRNFGYDTASKSCLKVGDLILSKEGSLFYFLLEDRLLPLDLIVRKLMKTFFEVDYDLLYKDAYLFYNELSKKGFVLCAENDDDLKLPLYFSYSNKKLFDISTLDKDSTNFRYSSSDDFKNLSQVHINISGVCNENCSHCYIPVKNKFGIMSEELFDKIISECVDLKVLNVTLSGGEPMMNPCLHSFLKKCKRYNFSINILSNLTNLTNELLDEIASNPLISVQTSLYAIDENVHDLITHQKGSFRKTLNSIHLLHERNVPMQINCPILKQNIQHYHDVISFASSLNISYSTDYALFGCYDSSGSNIGCRISMAEVSEVLNVAFRDTNTLNEAIQTSLYKKISDEDYICSVCKSSLCVSHNGDVYPCEGWQRMVLGNLERSSLADIWTNKPITKHLRNLRFKDFHECSTCNNKECCSPCLVMNANESLTNDYMRVNSYVCKIAMAKRDAMNVASKNIHNQLLMG